jgi:ADP-heptose:LPS heptosyltransferase
MSKVVLSRRVEENKIRQLTLREFYEARNTILIIRQIGGLGDILMHRMIFEDIKLLMPDVKVHFACPEQYHDAVIDHPFIDAVLDSNTIYKYNYIISYNTSSVCGRYELSIAPKSDLHRSDIWSTHCGLNLTRHNMHINISEEEKEWARQKIAKVRDRDGLVVLVSPVSAMENKNLLRNQQEELIKGMWERGLCPIGIHNEAMLDMLKLNVPQINRTSIRQWMALISECDAVLSVDTSTFHCAGGLGKPLVGVFTFASGKTYGKYFDFVLVQKDTDTDPGWCGPCYDWCNCVKTKLNPKPCLTEITGDMLLNGIDTMLKKRFGR